MNFQKELLLLGKQFLYLSLPAAVWVPNKVDTACVDRKSRLKLKFKQSIFWWGLRKVIYHWNFNDIQYMYSIYIQPSLHPINEYLFQIFQWSVCWSIIIDWDQNCGASDRLVEKSSLYDQHRWGRWVRPLSFHLSCPYTVGNREECQCFLWCAFVKPKKAFIYYYYYYYYLFIYFIFIINVTKP